MMHPKITDFTNRAFAEPSVKNVVINTNGGLRTPDWYTTMGEKFGGDLQIIFGIDGMSHETNWKYREGVDWQRAIDNMLAFAAAGGNAGWHFIIFDWNWQEVHNAYNFARQIRIPITIKYNNRDFGLISDENKIKCDELLESMGIRYEN